VHGEMLAMRQEVRETTKNLDGAK
jgi:hypothetical protein